MNCLTFRSAVCLILSLFLNFAWTRHHNLEERQAGPDNSTSNNTIVVSLNPGQEVRGFYRALATGTVIYKFWGIKYAQAPTGDKRFAEPVAEPDWQGVRDALHSGNKCWQTPTGHDESEDCLFLNVYTPTVTGSAAVMVWIHGGAYIAGAGSDGMFDGSTLAAKGVVVVTLNYRLGAYGFLSTEDDVMPGNYGLLDQVLALKWVQKNIHAFGGDPTKVTIFGESAGSSSVSLQILSPLSKGLFQRAIMESGSSLSVWAVERPAADISVEEYTRLVGADVGCFDADSTKFLACLRKVDAQVLFNVSYTLKNALDKRIIANPRVETKFGFLPHYPKYLLENGLFNKVDTLRGFNSGEFAFFITDPDDDGITRDEFKTNFNNLLSLYAVDNNSIEHIYNTFENIYLGNETNPIAIRSSLINTFTDTFFAVPELLELETSIVNGAAAFNHYVYQLDYRIQTFLNLQRLAPDWYGVIHSGDLPLVFTDDQVGIIATLTPPDDVEVGDKVQTWWTNFAKFGNPSATKVVEDGVEVRWDQYTPTNPQVLHIDVKSSLSPYARHSSLGLYSSVLDFLQGINSTISSAH